MPEISEQSEKAIKLFLQFWWADLVWKAHETVAGAQIMLPVIREDREHAERLAGIVASAKEQVEDGRATQEQAKAAFAGHAGDEIARRLAMGGDSHKPAYLTPDQLYHQLLGLTLRDIAKAAEGLLPDNDDKRAEIHEACQQVCEWMWARPGMPESYYIPDGGNPSGLNWWDTPIGRLVMAALVWCQHDEYLTLTQAAELAGVTQATVSQWLTRGRLQKYIDPREANPQHATRVRRSEVEQLVKK